MKRSLMILPIAAMALLLTGCTTMLSMSMSGIGDLYRTDNRAEVAARLKAEAEAERLAAEARQAQWEARLAEANAAAAEAEYYAVVNNEPNYMSVVADDYESAYARRLYGFQSPTYNMPSSYYNMVNNSSIYYVTAYDPSYYNIMVSGDQVWVEPKYITSMFGSWGATNVTFGIYASPWNYGWSYHANPFYYSMWGYPRYSWYDWNWAMCYNPFYYDWYWGGCYDPFYPHYHHHHHHYHPGHHPMPPRPGYGPGHEHGDRPGYGPTAGSGASRGPGNLNGNRTNTGSRYTSPTSNRNYGANSRGEGRPTSGSTSLGFNSNSVRPSTGVVNSNHNAIESNTRINTGTTSGSGSGSNFRTGTTTTSGTRINTTTTTTTTQSRPGSSNNKVEASRTGNYRQGSSSSSSGSRVSSSSSSSRSSSSSSSSYRSGSSSSSSSNYRSGSSSSSSSYRSGSSSSSGSFRSGGTSSSSGSSRSGGSSGGSRR